MLIPAEMNTVIIIARPRYCALPSLYPFLIHDTTGIGEVACESLSSAWISWKPKKRR